jgi:hypothetical protein
VNEIVGLELNIARPITVDDAIGQAWVEGRRQFVVDIRARVTHTVVLNAGYEKFLERITLDQRREYWLALLAALPPMLGNFANDPMFISGLEKRLARELTRIYVDSHSGPKIEN